jgi:peroxiredoxin Q/BCP
MTAKTGAPAPAFTLTAHDGSTVSLADLRGKAVVLYFYPADATPGCTRQACDIRDSFPRFKKSSAVVLGVSPDAIDSHLRFREKYKLPFTLLSDEDRTVAKRYGVLREKKTFGRTYIGIVRTTFIIDAAGILRSIVPVKRVAPHAETVLELLKELEG